ncbi:MAG: hypothetical protein JJU22_11330 [Gammaproteobacteria bacterium]|nr:hypothetical protein [Gammaproteobacteria bacterium]
MVQTLTIVFVEPVSHAILEIKGALDMPKHLIYKLKIQGSYKPQTIPMQRLSEYMADLAALLGEPSSVHFDRLEEGSTVLVAAIDEPAIPKVSHRVTSIERGDAPADLRRIFSQLDRRLADDNAIGSLTAYPDEASEALVLSFPGIDRPQPVDYGLVRQYGTLEGVPVRVGGQDKTAHLIIEDRTQTYSGINLTRDQATEIAPYLYRKVVRLHGAGSWRRDEEGQWQLERFRVDQFDVLEDVPLLEVLEHVRSIQGSGWSDVDDPTALLQDLRGAPDDRRH